MLCSRLRPLCGVARQQLLQMQAYRIALAGASPKIGSWARLFSATAAAPKKGKVGPKSAASVRSGESGSDQEPAVFDAAAFTSTLDKTVAQFQAKIKEIKGSTEVSSKFSNLQVDLGSNSTQTLQEIATVAKRGNKLVIVAFDPKNVKHIRTAIVSGLNLPAEPLKDDKQSLAVNLPPDGNKNAELNRQLKDAYEHYRNSSSRSSVSSLRAKYLGPLKKSAQGKTSADSKKQMQQIETITKTYNTKLQDLFKQSEFR